MSARRNYKAIVVGGSLAGLFAATALRAIGWEVQVYERSAAALDSRGGGIVLQPAVLEAFRFAGIKTPHGLGVRSHNRIYLSQRGDIRDKQYAPQTQTSWNALYSYLVNAVPANNYHRGKKFIELQQTEAGVIARFADGTQAIGDLLIGADGAGSTVRQQVLPGVIPSYSGYVVWRGLVSENQVSEHARRQIYENFTFQQNPDSMMLEYMVPGVDGSTTAGQRRFNWLWYLKAADGPELEGVLTDSNGQRRDHSIAPGAMSAAQDAWFRRYAKAHLNPAFLELVDLTEEIFVQAILDLKVPQMMFDRVILLGDAAFVPRPHTAASTAKAASNAVQLAQSIARHEHLQDALVEWEQSQLREGSLLTDWGIDMGNRIMGIGRPATPSQDCSALSPEDQPPPTTA